MNFTLKNACGTTFPVDVMRVTEVIGAMPRDEAILGRALVRTRFSVSLAPVIKTGGGTYKEPDRFEHFEFQIHHRGWRRWLPFPDRDLQGLLDHHCAVELWTKNEDEKYPWIHWVFPSTSWLRKGRGWKGRSYGSAAKIPVEDFPEGEADIPDGGFWKTATPPPS